MQLELVPPERVGPIVVGMNFDAAQRELTNLPGYRPPTFGRRVEPGFAHFESEMSISVYPEAGRVKAIEIFRPEEGDSATYRGISVFELPAEQVIREMGAIERLDVVRGGLLVVAPELLLAFNRPHLPEGPDDEDGRYFESVLMAAPGYYEGPDGRPVY